jgi:hypothetical protein
MRNFFSLPATCLKDPEAVLFSCEGTAENNNCLQKTERKLRCCFFCRVNLNSVIKKKAGLVQSRIQPFFITLCPLLMTGEKLHFQPVFQENPTYGNENGGSLVGCFISRLPFIMYGMESC